MSDINDVKGICESEFEPLKSHFANNLKTGVDVGASLAVNIKGKFVVDLWGGMQMLKKRVHGKKIQLYTSFLLQR
ncbi:MAG: hypothetical protein ACFE94_04050 [Candidatus Hodarchaeota archaeon]